MEIIHHAENYRPDKDSVVTIGTFDGVHIGHRQILNNLIRQAHKKNRVSIVFTLYPHPRMVLNKDSDIKLINTIDERAELMSELGLDYLIIQPFDQEFSRVSAFEFVRDYLVEKLQMKKLIIGYDHHFGKNREGNIEQLREYSHIFDFEIEEIPAQDIDSVSVSSTKIRNALLEGEIQLGNTYLGHDFTIEGTVTRGNQIGSKLGFPTANINIDNPYKLLPKLGAYIVKSNIGNQDYYGMLNIGKRPTIDGKKKTIEVYFEGLNEDLYEKKLKVSFIKYLRPEKKFKSLDELKLQLQKDRSHLLKFIR